MNELTDEQICNIARSTQTAEPGRDGYVLPVAFARAVIAAHLGQQDAEIFRLNTALQKIIAVEADTVTTAFDMRRIAIAASRKEKS